MKKEKVDLREELREYRDEFNVVQEIACTKEEIAEFKKILKEGGELPEDVHVRICYDVDGEEMGKEYYRIYTPDLTEQEMQEYLTLKRLSLLKTIKNCAVFFTVLAIIGLSALALSLLIGLLYLLAA